MAYYFAHPPRLVLLLYLISIVLIVLGVLGYGGRGKMDLGDFGNYSGPALVILGIGGLVVTYLLDKAGV